ncbi:hypothetical protein [Cellulomonas iranensis]|uniref:hypothetical protein n=1 Tax=Cellulomonas iranensis TaxID=76862 RepID=UPI000B3D2CF5|nr:hypothetical protein [Cellulomonas iranensis]
MARNTIGVEVPAGTDAFDPQGDMVELGGSLAGRVVVPVTNVADRAQVAAALSPTPATPLYVHRADAPVGLELERTIDGTTWVAVGGPSYMQIRQTAVVARSAGQWTQGPVGSPAVVTTEGPQPWTHSGGIITVTETGVYELELTTSMSGPGFAVAIRRASDSRMLGQSAMGSTTSQTNQAVARARLSAGDAVYGLVYPTTALNLLADSPASPCTLSIARA